MPSNSHSERRRFSRADFHGSAELDWQGQRFLVQLLDLSLKGALLEPPADWQGNTGDAGRLHLRLGEPAQIDMEVELAHRHADRAGFHCRRIDIDSLGHLRRLLELNLQDPNLTERELQQLLDDWVGN
ncbi:PilZ domain-containing protein [Methylonatrum kenyense]|uniref:PilZ domain-containing protein n=1 Tax=Methylonatrum kenyense TaxID=455253 RepID=UPI0020C0C40D|nr:PilZ domain-containing protein [Methylonatrum kenyense]MCK8515509.1 PilZ domain-containing protein [Methylonatrum kenyense]